MNEKNIGNRGFIRTFCRSLIFSSCFFTWEALKRFGAAAKLLVIGGDAFTTFVNRKTFLSIILAKMFSRKRSNRSVQRRWDADVVTGGAHQSLNTIIDDDNDDIKNIIQ